MPKMSKKIQVEIPPAPDMSAEAAAYAAGRCRVCGIDEAGRGPLAGPVVAAAVVLPMGYELPGLNDSKKLTAKKREALYELLMAWQRPPCKRLMSLTFCVPPTWQWLVRLRVFHLRWIFV